MADDNASGASPEVVDILLWLRDDPIVCGVLVPLYREQDVIGRLVLSLKRLNWPASQLDIKLVCEKDDFDTIAAIRRERLPSNFELFLVSSGEPKTKPKALNYALQFARREIVAVFDVEDRHHPDQLLEAWQTFQAEGDKLACVQALLIIGSLCERLSSWLQNYGADGTGRLCLPVFDPDLLGVDFDIGLAGAMAAGAYAAFVGKNTAPAQPVLHLRE